MIKRYPLLRRLAWVALAAIVALAAPISSAEDDSSSATKQFQPSEKVATALSEKLKALQDSKNYNGMLDLVNGLLSGVAPTSYDAVYLLDMKARIYAQSEQLNKAIEPWEKALQVADQFHYFDDAKALEITKYLAQLLFSEAIESKDKEVQQQQIASAGRYLKHYLDKAPKAEPEMQALYAQILYYQATFDPQHINQGMLDEARQIIERGMNSMIHPKEGFYRLLLAVVQQQNDYARSAAIMELMVNEFPGKKDIWPMLFGTYVNLAGTARNDKERRDYYVRAINTMERAQALGFMNAPRDNYNLVTLYINAGQFGIATDMLRAGLEKGTIESTVNNWRILGAYYQQANKELDAIAALKQATKLFPNEGSLELLIGQIYQAIDKIKEAHDHYVLAVSKGNIGDKPHLAYLYLAYTAIELGDYDGAQKAINEAAATPDGAKDPQVKSVKEGIEATIAERDRIKAAAAASAKKL
jgi:tetratricopeptide (TPR) repeat protein